jgi:hypothetical protein
VDHVQSQTQWKKVKVASLEALIEPNLEDDAQFFIEEEEDPIVLHNPLDPFEEPPKPPIELKPLPPGPCYAFLNNNPTLL